MLRWITRLPHQHFHYSLNLLLFITAFMFNTHLIFIFFFFFFSFFFLFLFYLLIILLLIQIWVIDFFIIVRANIMNFIVLFWDFKQRPIILQSPNFDSLIEGGWSQNWFMWMPWNISAWNSLIAPSSAPRRLVLLRKSHRSFSSKKIVNVNLSISWPRIYISLSCCFNWGELASY